MSNKNLNGFLSSIASSRGLSDLRKKLKGADNENCPIRTLNQLMNPSMAVPKTNVSLRSLRSKPSSQPPSRQANDFSIRNEQSSAVMNATQENSAPSVSGIIGTSNVGEAPAEPSKDNHVFAVPTMRAPRPQKREPDFWMNEINKAASFAYLVLDKEDFEGLCTVLIVYVLNIIEENHGGDDLRDERQQQIFQEVKSWIDSMVSSEHRGTRGQSYPEGPGFRDMDNISSVSGYPPSNPPGFINNPWSQDQRNPVANANCTVQFRGFDNGSSGSVYGYNNMCRHGTPSVANNSMVSNYANRLLPSFVKQRMYSDSSIVGSMYGGPAMSLENYGNQTSCFHGNQNQSVMGYTGQCMKVAPVHTVRGKVNAPLDNCSMMNAAPYHRTNQAGQSLIEERMDGNQNNPCYPRHVGLSYMNRSNAVPFNPDRSTASGQHTDRMPSRNVLAPLQPHVMLNRLNLRENVNQDHGYDDRDGEERSSERYLRNRDGEYLNKTGGQVRYALRSMDRNTSVVRTVNKDSFKNPEIHTRLKSHNSMVKDTPIRRPSPLRMGQNHAPDTPARGGVMNLSGVIRVTKSGRVVRAPQLYWSTDASVVNAACSSSVQERGVKRKRNFNL